MGAEQKENTVKSFKNLAIKWRRERGWKFRRMWGDFRFSFLVSSSNSCSVISLK